MVVVIEVDIIRGGNMFVAFFRNLKAQMGMPWYTICIIMLLCAYIEISWCSRLASTMNIKQFAVAKREVNRPEDFKLVEDIDQR